MNILDRYAVAYKGLSAGKHEYEFELDGAFFAAFGNPDIADGKGIADIVLTKSETLLEIDARIEAEITVPCDRCLEPLALPVDYRGGFKVRFSDAGGAKEDFDGEIMWLGHGESILNLANYIYESIVLSLPYAKLHPDREDGSYGCDPAAFANVRIITRQEFDRAGESSEMQKMEENPEWQKLREIRNKL